MLKARQMLSSRGLMAVLVTAVCLTVQAPALLAQSPQASQMMQLEQVTLTKTQVDGFIQSLPEFERLGKKYDKGQSADAGPMDAASRLFQYQAAHAEMQKVLTANGFSNYLDWVKVAQTVAITYSFVRSGEKPGGLSAQAQKAFDEIDKDPGMSAEQKAQIKAMMQQQMAFAKKLEPKPENVALIKSMLPQLSAVMDAQ